MTSQEHVTTNIEIRATQSPHSIQNSYPERAANPTGILEPAPGISRHGGGEASESEQIDRNRKKEIGTVEAMPCG
jgi:hypothetical protein